MKKHFFLILCFLGFFSSAHAELEFQAKFNFGNRFGTTWDPLYGGVVSLEFVLLKYFGLEAGLKATTFNTSDGVGLINFGPRLAPQFLLPFEIGAVSLIPYLMAAVDFPFMSFVDRKFGFGVGLEGGVGLKLIVGKIGWLIEWGAEYIKRTTAPVLEFTPHRISTGIVVKF